MVAAPAAAPGDVDEALADFQGHLNLIFTRARSLWKESAARIHPELQPAGYKLLTFIAREGSTNAHQLAERFEMDKSVVSRQVRMLEELELLQSRPDENDGRLRVLTATPAACAALADIRGSHAQRLRTALTELTPDEVRVASKVFRLLAEI
ncbi:MarR family winged helix-turn-helix transcriptional regulator [Microbacterium sp. CIAB417]|uniref:MarR family winged helix-turn-helix transcriptional regulator n=1 Tax=Microbacterium sp. CIAB417 TaxID=2860287 RepID=UPI001FABB936|nr:MarR family winged helix-turn-helix transcriptional regulator [Microbacterium sp. CIAB417]